MDIVDINKVLDDLEFNEEQRAKLSKTSEHNDRPSPALSNNQKFYANDHARTAIAATQLPSQPPIPNRIFKKNFVNVSNVFSSLNEYVNAGIDTAKKSNENVATPTYSSTTPIALVDDNGCSSSSLNGLTNIVNHEPTNSTSTDHPHVANVATSNAIDVKSSTKQECQLIVQNQSKNVPNHSVNKDSACERLDEDDKQEHEVMENAVLSESQMIANGKIDMAVSSKDAAVNIEKDEDMENEVEIDKLGESEVKLEIEGEEEQREAEIEWHPQCQNQLERDSTPTELDVEIECKQMPESSIVNSVHNMEIDLNKQSNGTVQNKPDATANAKHIENLDNDENSDSDSQLVQSNNLRPASNNNCEQSDSMQQMNADIGASKSTDLVKPISFEQAATMDVSVAELESYLETLEQDMEDDKPNTDRKASIETHRSYLPIDTMHEALRDDRNADSFSQASTIEFGDGNLDGEIQLSASQFSLMNLHTVDEPTVPTVHNSEHTDALNEDQLNVDANNDDFGESSDEHGANTASALKRPTSLNLCKVYEVAQPTNNAGNTPMLLTTAHPMPSGSSDGTIETSSPYTSEGTLETSSPFTSEGTLETSSPLTHTEESNAEANSEGSDPVLNYSATATDTQPASNRPAPTHLSNSANISLENIGKVQPYWIPDNMSLFCMICNIKFTFIKRRHHCRACGLVLCKACCSLKAKLEYMGDAEARICIQCDVLLNKSDDEGRASNRPDTDGGAAGIDIASGLDPLSNSDTNVPAITRSPNPNNPMEYCSVIPPHQQVGTSSLAPISVMVPVGILKRSGSKTQRKEKNVMFSDGLRPNVDLDMDCSWEPHSTNENGDTVTAVDRKAPSRPRNADKLPMLDPKTKSYIPPSRPSTSSDMADISLPPICLSTPTEFKYAEVENNKQLLTRLEAEQLKFMISRNFYVLVRIIKLTCCINRTVINYTTQGMHLVGQDEVVILLELDESNQLPKDIFIHLNEIYHDADKGQAITELGFSMASATPFLGSKEHGGFLFIRTTFQCMQNITIPESPYLIGILIHRWEVPWAKVFPLRLMLRLGALHRYYPSPHVSVRQRDSVYAEIAQTIINFLADFRTYSYTLPTIRGMYIHMEDRRTNVLIPRNRYDQIMKALGNSSDHIIALAANFSKTADGHLVCVQNTESGCAETHAYSTQAINIQGKPRKVTGASFLVLNGALKSTSGLSGKCSIVEDGLMVQILPKKMTAIQQALKTMKDIDIVCGPVDGDDTQTEVVAIQWIENDTDFNVGVTSLIDNKLMDGIPSIRVHQGLDFINSYHMIRWTEVFILKSDEESAHGKDPIDISKLSESIARSTSMALVPFVDLLASTNQTKFAIRATLDQDQVCYEAASRTEKLGPLYMNALDNELIPLLHRQATNLQLDQTICLELIFYILDA